MWPRHTYCTGNRERKFRNLDKTILDYKDVVDNYVKVEDWRVKENFHHHIFCWRA